MRWNLLVTLLVLLLSAAALGLGAGSAEEEWITLFDGTSLQGWKASERPENWTLENGVLKGSGARSHLFYVDREFTNFEFEAEVMTRPGSNSGLYFHTRFQEGGWPQYGYESQVNNTHRDPVKTGSLYGVVKLYKSAAQDDQWWTQSIRVQEKNITIKINGEVVIDYTEPEGVTGPRRLDRGLFALQQHDPGSVVFYRNIRVRPLPD